jgi:glutaredoxin 3
MKVDIISKDNCSFCVSAKILLEKKGLSYTERKLGEGLTREQILEEFPTARTFPIISLNDEYIGGYDKLSEKLKDYDPEI